MLSPQVHFCMDPLQPQGAPQGPQDSGSSCPKGLKPFSGAYPGLSQLSPLWSPLATLPPCSALTPGLQGLAEGGRVGDPPPPTSHVAAKPPCEVHVNLIPPHPCPVFTASK